MLCMSRVRMMLGLFRAWQREAGNFGGKRTCPCSFLAPNIKENVECEAEYHREGEQAKVVSEDVKSGWRLVHGRK